MSMGQIPAKQWLPGDAPVAVVILALNEAHHLEAMLRNISGWAQEVFLVDSFSADATVDIALAHGVHVVQRRFRGFGDQWNFALRTLPITARWTMKLDPDERLTEAFKAEARQRLRDADEAGFSVPIRLFFLGRPLAHVLRLTRLWRTGAASFSDVAANEHAHVDGAMGRLQGEIEHHDSPNLEHWLHKQNRYSTAEAAMRFHDRALADTPALFGTSLQRRMWLKRHFWKMPGRYVLLFWHHFLLLGAWRAGRVGWIWSRLRTEIFRMQEYKLLEMQMLGRVPAPLVFHAGTPDPRVEQYD
jgi:glycosyltransferase involved in cell wall biosynthesis